MTLKPSAHSINVNTQGTGLALIGADNFWRHDLPRRRSYHEAGHCVAALVFSAPIIGVTINEANPHMHRGCWHTDHPLALANLVTLCLCGPESESVYVGPITDGSDQIDIDMAKAYLAAGGVDPLLIGVEMARLRDSANSLVQTPWATSRIATIAAALLQQETLTGEQIAALA